MLSILERSGLTDSLFYLLLFALSYLIVRLVPENKEGKTTE